MSEESDVYEEEQITLEEQIALEEEPEEDWDELKRIARLTWKEMNEAEWERIYEDDVRTIEEVEEYFQQRWENWY